jgi:erythromycin esterase
MKTNRITPRFLLGVTLCLLAATGPATARPDRDAAATDTLRALAVPLDDPGDLTPLVERAASVRLVLLGESTHGTSEFYAWRSEISKRLIRVKGFRFIAVEGDWADIYRLNRYVKGLPGAEKEARGIMESFRRWPTWMWANEETLALVEWLRVHNLRLPMEERVGFYGMDVYGDDHVLNAMLAKLAALDGNLAEEMRALYGPYLPVAGDPSLYGQSLARGASFAPAAREGYALLKERTRPLLEENPAARFNLLQSALVVQNAEAHYRAMHHPGENSWNARADHFFLTVERLLEHYGEGAQGIVWAHNTHIGDARATPMAQRGDRNIGMAARTALGAENVLAVGFGTDRGTAIAGRQWGAPPERMALPPSGPGSVEALMAATELEAALLVFDPEADLSALAAPRGHRAVGVVYNPEHEFPGNYVPTRLTDRYDAFIFIRTTRALRPIAGPPD